MNKTGSQKPKPTAVSGQEVVVRKKTSIKGFTPEEELKYLVERGDWELVLTSKVFQNRSPESKAQLIQEAVDRRIEQLGKTLNYLVNRGPEHHAAAMGVLQRRKQLENIRDEILKKIYEQYPRTLSDKAGIKIDFY